MSEERKDQIMKVLAEKGALGVNALAREIDINVSTLQKYLHNQTYFRINDSKKWDLPENVISSVKTNSLELLANVSFNSVALIRSEIEELLIHVDNALSPLKTLQKDITRIQHPVADSGQVRFNEKWVEAYEMLEKLPSIIKSKKDNVSEENYELLRNVDWYHLYLDMGASYFINEISSEIYDILLGQTDKLSEDALTTIKEYTP